MGKIKHYRGDEEGGVTLERNCWPNWNDASTRRFVEPEAKSERQRTTIITVRDVDDRLIEKDLIVCHREEEEDQEHVTAIDESQLEYRAEGNANIVLSVKGSRYVLRLRKSDVMRGTGKDVPIDRVRFIKYTRVVASLFSKHFVLELKPGRVETDDLDAFNRRLKPFRPVTRLDKEIRVRDGILYLDVAFLPAKLSLQRKDCYSDYRQSNQSLNSSHSTYCVEIKPKQGWSFLDEEYAEDEPIPICDSLALPELGETSGGKCRFCLFQYSKLQKKTIGTISKYCPLDLFSGNQLRMLHAIQGLIKTPQNNFKLSKNGRIVYDETRHKGIFNRVLKEIFQRDQQSKEGRKTIFMNLIKQTLLKDYSTNEANSNLTLLRIRRNRKKKDKNLIHERICDPINYNRLPKNCALKQIQDVQLLVKSNLRLVQPDKLHQHRYIDELYEKFIECCEDHPNTSLGKFRQFVDDYLIPEEQYQLGATALDCSIMITFRRLADREEKSMPAVALRHIVSIEGIKFLTNVTITDLDPKTLQHVQRKYLGQLRESAVAYREFLSRMKR